MKRTVAILLLAILAPTGTSAIAAKGKHWAYVKPQRPSLPAVRDQSWCRNAIDRFVLAKLDAEGLRPSPEAERATLLRRVSLDLIGLPPSPAEVDAFLNDNSPDAYDRVVDRLLASPHFGERWARPWLDLARYADSHGFQRDDLRELWAYRDWVIKALNADMPFDQFTIEQLAGDLLPNATVEQRIATGFNRCTPTNVEAGSEPEETRVNQVFDRVDTLGTAWLGTTLECAQCHDHKYDPFRQKEYYQLFAFFNQTAVEADREKPNVPGSIKFLGPTMELPNDAAGVADAAESSAERLALKLRDLDERIAKRRQALEADLAKWEAQTLVSLDKRGQEHPLTVTAFESSAASPHKVLDDGSILLVDDPPEKDTYTVTVQTDLTGITAFRLDALTDPSLPGNGPGRGDKNRPNFILHAFDVTAAPSDNASSPQPVRLTGARASYSQPRFNVAAAIDGKPATGWAIGQQFHVPHWAIFEADKPLGFTGGTRLTFALEQNFGRGRTIGRFRLSALTGDPRAGAVPADVAGALRTPRQQRTADQSKRLLEYRLEQDADYARLIAERNQAKPAKAKPPTTLVMQELPSTRPSAVFMRGSYRDPGEPVQPATPAVLHAMPSGAAGNRLTLAKWLVDRENPLVARVGVNRWSAEIFGRGIVSTLEDFGAKGEPPTHPELLDWLAMEFMDNGWSSKHVLRTIVTSATYRQSSRQSPELRERDPENRLLARGPRFRLDAEAIRDNALAAAGLLSRKQFGPPVRPYQPDGLWVKVGGERVEYVTNPGEDQHRRGIYVVWKRGAPYPSFVNFDATARLACTVKRSRSNTPLQALTLLNDPVYVEAAEALSRRIVADTPGADVDGRIAYAFKLCVARTPSPRETAVLRSLHSSSSSSQGESAGWNAVATALLNLDEMITKP